MATALSVETRISEFLNRHKDLTIERFCLILDPRIISSTRLSQALADVRPLETPQQEAARHTIEAIEDLLRRCEPLPISLRSPRVIKQLLSAMRDETLRIDVAINEKDWRQKESE